MNKKSFDLKKVTFDKLCLNLLSNLIFVYCLIIAIALIIFSTSTIECEVTGSSMKPTYNMEKGKNDYVYVNKYDNEYDYCDVIVVYTDNEPLIKRIVGLPGDIIDIVKVNGVYMLERNGEIVEENYIFDNGAFCELEERNGMNETVVRFDEYKNNNKILLNKDGKLVIREDEVFALGDNRKVSSDSSERGAFKIDDIAGIVERDRFHDESIIDFYYDYILNGEFFVTIANIL